MILRGSGLDGSFLCLPVIPGHPFRGVLFQLLGMPLQIGEVVERIDAVELAAMDQTHEKVADFSPVPRLVKKGVLPVQNRFL